MSGAHGLTHGLATRDWPKLTVSELIPVFAAYPGLGAPLRVAWHSQRPFASSALVVAEAGTVFAKRHDPQVRSPAGLAEEHEFIAHLRAEGAGVPRVLQAADNRTALAGPAGTYELHEMAEGDDRYRDDLSWTPVRTAHDAAAVGRALARLHQAARGFAALARRAKMLVAGDALLRDPDPVRALEHRLAAEPRLRAALAARPWREDFARVLLPWHRTAQALAAAQPALWAHGDLHASNTLWAGDEVVYTLDFGLCNRASAMADLATAIERNCIDWLELSASHDDIGRAELALALIDGYARRLPLTAGQRAALVAILPVVHLDFAISELAYFHTVTCSPPNAEAAYSDFLLGHPAWFATMPGRAFLDRIAG